MSGEYQDLERAKEEAEKARRRLIETLGTIRHRLSPGVLASEAWGGVRGKSGELADDALQAIKDRPKTVSVALAAFTLFLAREPIRSAASRLFSDGAEGKKPASTRKNKSKTEGVN